MNSELTSDEIPPQNLWHHHERLEEWFSAVSERRKARFSGKDVEDVPQADDDDEEGFEISDPEVRALRAVE